jgi:hypothetical protein
MVQLQYTSRIKLDEKLFNKIDKVIKLIERVDAELPADSPIRAEPDYQKMLGHRRIDSFKVIEAKLDHDLANASDFSRSSVEARDRSRLRRRHAPRRRLGGVRRRRNFAVPAPRPAEQDTAKSLTRQRYSMMTLEASLEPPAPSTITSTVPEPSGTSTTKVSPSTSNETCWSPKETFSAVAKASPWMMTDWPGDTRLGSTLSIRMETPH